MDAIVSRLSYGMIELQQEMMYVLGFICQIQPRASRSKHIRFVHDPLHWFVHSLPIGSCMVSPFNHRTSRDGLCKQAGSASSCLSAPTVQARKLKADKNWAAAGAPGSCLAFILSRTARRCCCSSLLAFCSAPRTIIT